MGVRVLVFRIPEGPRLWYDHFVGSLSGKHDIIPFDPEAPLAAQFSGIDVVVDSNSNASTREAIDAAAAAGVKLWQTSTNGLDDVPVEYFVEKGLPLAHCPGPFSAVALAEHALFLMLCCSKELKRAWRNARVGVLHLPTHTELMGKNLGLVGFGASGRELARRACAMGMRTMAVDVVDPGRRVLDEYHVGFFGDPSQLDKVLKEADYVSLHVPLTPDTEGMIDRRALELMKPESVLINVARGAIVDELALVEALQTGQIKAAGLDVVIGEPIDPAHPFLEMDNVVLTPHIAAATYETRERRAEAAAQNVERISQGLPPLFAVT